MSYEEVMLYRQTGRLPICYLTDGCPCDYGIYLCLIHEGWQFDSHADKIRFMEDCHSQGEEANPDCVERCQSQSAEVKSTPSSQKPKTVVLPQSKRLRKRIQHKIISTENAICCRSKSPRWLSVSYRR